MSAMDTLPVRVASTGLYAPETVLTSATLEARLGLQPLLPCCSLPNLAITENRSTALEALHTRSAHAGDRVLGNRWMSDRP
jgi:hypothetical protein